jgi:predicted transcriptional regulator
MIKLDDLLQEIGVSKVRLAKYLGVSRQMVYNYLELEDLNKWPKEKKILLFKLFDIEDGNEETLKKIKVNAEYLEKIESRLYSNIKEEETTEQYFDTKGLSKEEKQLLNDIIFIVKEKFTDEKKSKDSYYTFLYLYHALQSMDNVPEIKYILAYFSKKNGFTDPNEFKLDETKQFILESIIFTAFNLYNDGGATKSKLVESHNRFVQEINAEKEEALSRTQQLNSLKVQALKELGYTDITKENATEVFTKIAEIQSRRP